MRGMVIDGLSTPTVSLQIVCPAITCFGFGFDPILSGVAAMIVIGMGMITPPVALNVFAARGGGRRGRCRRRRSSARRRHPGCRPSDPRFHLRLNGARMASRKARGLTPPRAFIMFRAYSGAPRGASRKR